MEVKIRCLLKIQTKQKNDLKDTEFQRSDPKVNKHMFDHQKECDFDKFVQS